MPYIQDITAREILDSRGNPTLEVDVLLGSGAVGRAAVPSGASTGQFEAVELRDGDKKRYGGKGVLKAVANVNDTIAPELLDHDATDQGAVDAALLELDGTPNKRNLGANAIWASPSPSPRRRRTTSSFPLPLRRRGHRPHVAGADAEYPQRRAACGLERGLQEFMVLPVGAGSFTEALQMGWRSSTP